MYLTSPKVRSAWSCWRSKSGLKMRFLILLAGLKVQYGTSTNCVHLGSALLVIGF